MAYTEATLTAQIDPAGTGRVAQIVDFYPGPTKTQAYVVGVIAPYAGYSRWVELTTSDTAATAAADLLSQLIKYR